MDCHAGRALLVVGPASAAVRRLVCYLGGMRFVLLLLLTACSGGGPAPRSAASGVHGAVPEAGQSVPEFAALSHDGSTRSREDLLGHPTLIWFFPAAGTPG